MGVSTLPLCGVYGGIHSPSVGSVWGYPLSHCVECIGVSPLLLWGVYGGIPSPTVGSLEWMLCDASFKSLLSTNLGSPKLSCF